MDSSIKIAFKNSFDKSLLSKINGVHAVINDEHGFKLTCDNNPAIREEIFALAVQLNNPIMRLEPHAEDLESIFRQLTTQAN